MPSATARPIRCTVLPPVPVPYRDPLFRGLAALEALELDVVYVNAEQPSWDQASEWFATAHGYRSSALTSFQRARARSGRTPIAVPRGLRRRLDELDPAVVVAWEYGPVTWLAALWCRIHRRRLVVFTELTPDADSQLSGLQLRVHRALAPRVAGFVAASSAAGRRLRALGVDPGRIEVSVQSADVDAFSSVVRRRPRGGPLRVLCVARLVPDKNLPMLMRAFARAGFGQDEAQLEIFGSGPLRSELERLAESLPAAITICGYKPPRALPGIYADVDVYALASTFETFGVSLREAAAAGLPIICSDRAGAVGDVVIDGHNAVVFDPADEAGLTETVRAVLGNEDLRARLAAGSRAVTAEHPISADVVTFARAVQAAAR